MATCKALVNSMPNRVKAVLENNGVHTFHLEVYSFLWPEVWTLMAVCGVILRGQKMYTILYTHYFTL